MAVNTKFSVSKTVIGGIYQSDPPSVLDGEPVSLHLDSTGRIKVSTFPFDPINGSGQALAYGAVAIRSTQLTIGGIYWLWATEKVWIAIGDETIIATPADFPLPPGAVIEYSPSTDRDFISAIQMDQVGTLYIGRSA